MQSARVLRGLYLLKHIKPFKKKTNRDLIAAYRPAVRQTLGQRFYTAHTGTVTVKKPWSKWNTVKTVGKLGVVGFLGSTFYSK